ncbi:MAG: fibrillarin-like rRNA/tRNA 2'-O-methyltransferase [Candidatus Thorarchaeota archaeon]
MTAVKELRFPGVYRVQDQNKSSLATQTIISSQSVYGEKLVKVDDVEYRLWSTRRSKLAAAIQKGLNEMPIQPGSKVLYLGAASGTTVSHVSDIVGPAGAVYAVEFSPRIARDLFQLAITRKNIIPIVDDARHPSRYSPLVAGPIDVVYQDVAQSDQASILYENLSTFCSFGAWGMIAIKARSIDSSMDVQTIYSNEISLMDESGLEIVERVNLDPLEKDHMFVVVRVTEAMK